MPVQIIVKDSRYFYQTKNGSDFSLNTGDYTPNLRGNVAGRVKALQKVDVEWFASNSASDAWRVDGNTMRKTTGSFINEGFKVGDTCDHLINWSTSKTFQASFTIDSISSDGKYMIYTITAGSIPDGNYTDSGIKGTTPLTALIYRWGLIENNEEFNVISKVSGGDQEYYADGLSTSFKNMSFKGTLNGAISGSARARKVGTVGYVQSFEIEHIFVLNPWYLEDNDVNIENQSPPDLFAGENTIKHSYQLEFRTALSNPNTAKTALVDNNLGSVGYFGEVNNGFDSNYTVDTIVYQDSITGDSTDGLQISSKTRATITLSKLSGAFAAGDHVSVYTSYLARQTEYQDTVTDMLENFIYDTVRTNIGATTGGTGVIKLISPSIVAGKLVVLVDFEYTTAQQLRLTSDSRYFISVEVQDQTTTNSDSDAVNLIADVNNYDLSAEIPGLVTLADWQIFQHNQDPDIDTGYTSLRTWPADGHVIKHDFALDLAKNAFVNSLEFLLIAYNSVKNSYFILDNYTFPVSGSIVSGGVQQLEVDTERGYMLKSGDSFNSIKLTTGARVVDIQNYSLQIAQKIKWQDWILNRAVDSDFYDKTKPNDNLNYLSSNYSNLDGYQIKLATRLNISGVDDLGRSGTTVYLLSSPDIDVKAFDEPADWTAEIKTLHPDTGADLGGAIRSDGNTFMQVIYTDTSGPFTDILGYWAVNKIQPSNSSSDDIYEGSSLRDEMALNPIGDTTLRIDGGKVYAECTIFVDRIDSSIDYDLYGRLDDGKSAVGVYKLTSDGTIKQTSGGINKQLS